MNTVVFSVVSADTTEKNERYAMVCPQCGKEMEDQSVEQWFCPICDEMFDYYDEDDGSD